MRNGAKESLRLAMSNGKTYPSFLIAWSLSDGLFAGKENL